MSEYDDLLDEVMSDELTEGGAVVVNTDESGSAQGMGEEQKEEASQPSVRPERTSPPSVSIIKTPEEVPAAIERVVGPTIHDRAYIDQEWLLRRAGKKKR